MVSSGIQPQYVSENGITGGVRIKEIKSTPGTTTTFKYVFNYDTDNSSTSQAGFYLIMEYTGYT